MSSLEDLLNAEDSSDEENFSNTIQTTLALKSVDIDDLLNMKDEEDEDDPAVLSSTIYEQFSHLMKTNEKIQKELATASDSLVPSLPVSLSSETKSGPMRVGDREEPSEGLDIANIASAELLRSLVENDDDDDTAEHSPHSASPLPRNSRMDALRSAELREQKALHFTEKNNVSALQIRRSSTITSSNGGGVAGTPPLVGSIGGSVMTGIEEMSLINNQLKKNASYQQHGPGIATAITLCSKFVAIGTIKGFILIFDHHQEIRKVLTHPNPLKAPSVGNMGGSGTAPALSTALNGMTVVGLDCLSDGTMIISAHRMGEILFWDSVKGSVIKQIKDPSNAEIITLRFLRPVATVEPRHTFSLSESDAFHVLVLTATSVINRYKLTKSLLSTWHCDIDCLLDESSGQVVSCAVLSPFSHYDSNQSAEPPSPLVQATVTSTSLSRFYSDLRSQRGVVQLFAFGFATQTCIVQSSPEVRILFKWPNPNYSLYESKESKEILDWTWMKVPFELSPITLHTANVFHLEKKEGMVCAVLTRVRETLIELLVVRVKRTASSQAAVTSISEMTGASVGGGSSSRGLGGRASILMFVGNALTGGGSSSSVEDAPSLSFECIPWMNRSIPNQFNHVLSIKWIKSSQLIAFTKAEVLLFDAALNVLERCLLLPAISNGFIATIDRANTTTTEIRPEIATMNGEGYVLTAMAAFKLFTKSPFEQANSLINSGRWLEGLSLIVENISKSPTLLVTESEHIRRYIINYTLLAVKRSTSAALEGSSHSNSRLSSSSGINNNNNNASKHSRNHYHLVASVCTEYCVATRQFSLLFQEILDVFRVENQQDILLESLEPFLLNRSISALPVNILLDFFQMGVSLNKLPQIERCLIALDPRTLFSSRSQLVAAAAAEIIDQRQILQRLFQYKMFSSFLYYYSIGWNDVSSAFQVMFQYLLQHYDLQASSSSSAAPSVMDSSAYHARNNPSASSASSALTSFDEEEERRSYYYKLFLFVYHVFEGKVFPKGLPNNEFYSGDEVSFPFSSPALSALSVAAASPNPNTNTNSLSIESQQDPPVSTQQQQQQHGHLEGSASSSPRARLVNGFHVNAIWDLLNLLVIDEMPKFVEISSSSVLSRDFYEQHALRQVEFPILNYFSRFDHITLFQVLLRGLENMIALFVSLSASTKDTSVSLTESPPMIPAATNPSSSSVGSVVSTHNHLIIGSLSPSSAAGMKWEGISITREVIPFQTRQKNEAHIMSLLQNIFLFAKEESERLLDDFFQFFSPLFLKLSNAVISQDLLLALVSYYSSQRSKSEFSLKKCEEQMQALLENQLKLVLSSAGGGGASTKFNAFSERVVKALQQYEFYWTSFAVKRLNVKLFFSPSPAAAIVTRSSSSTSTPSAQTPQPSAQAQNEKNDFSLQIMTYVRFIKAKRDPVAVNPPFDPVTTAQSAPSSSYVNSNSNSGRIAHHHATANTKPSASFSSSFHNSSGTSHPIKADEDAIDVLFSFITEGLDYFERERSLLLSSSTSNASSSSSSSLTANNNYNNNAGTTAGSGGTATNATNGNATGMVNTGWSLASIEQILNYFREAVQSVMVDLLEISVEKTVQLIITPFFLSPSSLRGLIDVSKKNSFLQFQALQLLITQQYLYHQQSNSYFNIKLYLMNQELLYFLRLHCSYSPDNLLAFLRKYIFLSIPNYAAASSSSSSVFEGGVNTRSSEIVSSSAAVVVEEHFPLDEMAAILKEFPHISDGIAFFEEKFGHIEEALSILLKDFSTKLKVVRKEIDTLLRFDSGSISISPSSASAKPSTTSSSSIVQLLLQVRAIVSSSAIYRHTVSTSSSSSSSSSPSSSNQLQQLLGDMTSHINSCKSLRYSLACISELCERQSPSSFLSLGAAESRHSLGVEDSFFETAPYNRELAERLWYKAFDHLLSERQQLRESLIVSSSSQISSQYLTFLIQEFMNKMKTIISSQEIISRVLNYASSSSSSSASSSSSNPKNSIVLGEFKEIMNNMIHSNASELLLYENMKKILLSDVKTIHQLKIKKKRAFVYRSEGGGGGGGESSSSLMESQSENAAVPIDAVTQVAARRRVSSRGRPFRMKDMKSMTSRAQEKLIACLPRTTLPTNIGDFDLNFEERRPGQLERKARFSVQIEVSTPWQ